MRMLNLPVHVVKFSIKLRRSPLLTVAIVSVMAILLAVSAFVAKRSSAHGANSTNKETARLLRK